MTYKVRAIDVIDGVCRPIEIPSSDLGPEGVRIEVEAIGVNRADLVQKAGRYPPPPGASPILGLEVAGIVTGFASSVEGLRVGDRVCALLTGGGYAEEVVAPAGCVLPVPDGLDAVQAAAILETWTTAWLNLGRLGGLHRRQGAAHVLLHAGASGVGTAGLQLCSAWGHPTFVTAGSPDKIERCVALGAAGGANRHDGPWLPAVQAWAPDGVDAILDPVGGPYFADNLQALAPDGRLILIGLMGGREAPIDLGRMLMKRIRVEGSTLRARTVPFKARLLQELRSFTWPRFRDGRFKPVVEQTFPLDEAEAAHRRLASNETFGKLVLLP